MCSSGCIRKYVETSAVLTLLASGAALGFIINKMVQDGDFFDNNGFQFQQNSIWMLFGATMALLLGSLFGVYGSCRRGKHMCSLFVYNIFNIILTAVFLGFGFFYVFKFKNVVDSLKDSSNCDNLDSELSFITTANNGTNLAANYFCNSGCQCYVPSSLAVKMNMTNMNNVNSIDVNLPTNVQGCPGFSSFGISSDTANLMNLIEQTFSCSGICTGYGHYIFSNITSGIPKYTNGCKAELVNFMDNFGSYLMAISFVVGFFLFINVFFVFALCCHKDNKGKDVYALMRDEI